MPIDYSKYHPKWHKISRFVRFIRARNRCEHCGVANYAVGYWEKGEWQRLAGNLEADQFGFGEKTSREARKYVRQYNKHCIVDSDQPKLKVVILTVAHLDHNIDNNELENLAALCQSCHFRLDRKDNAQRRRYGPTGRFHKQIRISYESSLTDNSHHTKQITTHEGAH
ncbi:hypothetical protein IC229_05720 [Spirosoma sp. BT702]|uniref:HNH endonuclease n=1 Tax=Spirosoma profusum TaxID=2771354 RepID=A0A927AQC5_9BACT|nr:hypothetical protein [Spirosoma profusum]MBD2700123.1 hypothetical protein [Spirosoma profusum]